MKELEPQLFSNEKLIADTSENFKLLQQRYNLDKDKCIPFIGAGLSKPTGINGWYELLISMIEKFELQDKQTLIKDLDNNLYMETASRIYAQIEEKEYFDFLNLQFIQNSTLTTSTIIKIVSLFKAIITTNYDTTIENAFKTIEFIKTGKSTKTYNIQYLPKFDTFNFVGKNNVVYLHGYTNKSHYLLRKEDYEYFYPSISKKEDAVKMLEEFLKANIQKNCLIFFGFSFEDEYFYEFVKFLINEKKIEKERNQKFGFGNYEDEDIEHFSFIKLKNDSKKENLIHNNSLHNKLKEINIKPIYYEKNHAELEEKFLDEIPNFKNSLEIINDDLEKGFPSVPGQ